METIFYFTNNQGLEDQIYLSLITKLTFITFEEITAFVRQIDGNFICGSFLIDTNYSVISSPSSELVAIKKAHEALLLDLLHVFSSVGFLLHL